MKLLLSLVRFPFEWSLIEIAFTTCSNAKIVLQRPDSCAHPESWRGPTFSVRVWKRYADITYHLPGGLIARLDNVSEKINQPYVAAQKYLSFYSLMLPGARFSLDSLQFQILIWSSLTAEYPDAKDQQTLATMPWLIQLERDMQGLDLPEDNIISASVCLSVDRIILSAHSFYIFAIISSIVFSWCLSRVVQSNFTPMPPIASFADLDFAVKLIKTKGRNTQETVDNLFEDLETFGTVEIIKKFNEVRLQIHGPSEDREMEPLEQGLSRQRE